MMGQTGQVRNDGATGQVRNDCTAQFIEEIHIAQNGNLFIGYLKRQLMK